MKNNKEEKVTSISTENIYKLNGRVPLKKLFHLAYNMYLQCLYLT